MQKLNARSPIESIPFTDISSEIGNYANAKLQCLSSNMPAKWYHIKGDDKFYLADTCSSMTMADTYIVLVDSVEHADGKTCLNANCAKINDDGCGKGNHGSAVIFQAQKGKDYHIAVVGKMGENDVYQFNLQTVDNTLPMKDILGLIQQEFQL